MAAITCSNGTNPPAGRGTHRPRFAGTLILTNRIRFPAATRTARFRPRLEMNGNGCSASTASGVRIGRIERVKSLDSCAASFFASAV